MKYEIRFENGSPNVYSEVLREGELYEREDAVLVRVNQALHFGWVHRVLPDDFVMPEDSAWIEGAAAHADFAHKARVEEDSEEAKKDVIRMINEAGLDMKVVKTEFAFDYSYLFVSFTSDNRVDFRQLLRDLSSHFQMRIELRKIGVRDAAKLVGGIGPCGRPLCCAEFLYEFPSVSIKMIKTQQLSFNQSKINGMCGRLMCCLSYENDFYKEAAKEFPDFGDLIETEEGQGRVIAMNIIQRRITLRYPEFVREYQLDELLELNKEIAN